ncbi:MAG: aromatic amino acid transport family protein [Cyanobacteria bacterium J06639_18]
MTQIKTNIQSDEPKVTRLFSHLENDGNQLKHHPGSVFGSAALLAGNTVGAGILALPAVTLPSGIVPSTALLFAVWLYVLISGLLIAEVTLNRMRVEGRPNLGFLSIVEGTLGTFTGRLAGGAFLFFHYSLLVAYIARGGDILLGGASHILGIDGALPAWVGAIMFTSLFGSILYLGRDRFVEKLNSIFVVIVVFSFLGLVFLEGTQIHPVRFLFQDWRALPGAVSVMLVAMFFHSVVPVIVSQLEGDVQKIRKSIVIGSSIPLVMFLTWNAVILGSISPQIVENISSGETVFDPLQFLYTHGAQNILGVLIPVFSEFAIVTSFIGFFFGLRDFFQDMNLFEINQPVPRLPVISLVMFPPMGLSLINPNIFFGALDYAGSFSISILGGILPALMSWKQREADRNLNNDHKILAPGGKITLILTIAIALIIIIRQVLLMTPEF